MEFSLGTAYFKGVEMKELDEQEIRKLAKKRTKIAAIAAGTVFAAFVIHLYFAYGSIGYIDNLLKGDMVTIVSTILTSWVLIGWYILFRFFRNVP